MKVCSHCGGTEFSVSVVEYHSWKVDGEGNFIADLGCDEVDRGDADMTCMTCYASPAILIDKEPK